MKRVNKTWIVLGTKPRDPETEYTFCYIPEQDEFARHTRRIDDPDNLFWGHYFQSLDKAMTDWTLL